MSQPTIHGSCNDVPSARANYPRTVAQYSLSRAHITLEPTPESSPDSCSMPSTYEPLQSQVWLLLHIYWNNCEEIPRQRLDRYVVTWIAQASYGILRELSFGLLPALFLSFLSNALRWTSSIHVVVIVDLVWPDESKLHVEQPICTRSLCERKSIGHIEWPARRRHGKWQKTAGPSAQEL